ncbi:MAG: HAD-IIB family hydrolase [Clostridia bacterium]|nr:HAD-IIB family hydrolase [Clostridia bacterium]
MDLYISDLDGTLLNNEHRVSETSAAIINELIDRGLNFSVATARNIGTAFDKIAPLRLRTPVSFMNGVFIYAQNDPKPLSVLPLPADQAKILLTEAKKVGASPMFYSLNNRTDKIELQYADLNFPERRAFYEARKNSVYKQFIRADAYEFRDECTPVYINFLEEYDVLLRVQPIIETLPDIHSVFYFDPVLQAWYLESFSAKAGKASGAKRIAEMIGAERIICFGDNENDRSMFEIADECYATANADENIRAIADGVIGNCNEDGVALFLLKRFLQKQ